MGDSSRAVRGTPLRQFGAFADHCPLGPLSIAHHSRILYKIISSWYCFVIMAKRTRSKSKGRPSSLPGRECRPALLAVWARQLDVLAIHDNKFYNVFFGRTRYRSVWLSWKDLRTTCARQIPSASPSVPSHAPPPPISIRTFIIILILYLRLNIIFTIFCDALWPCRLWCRNFFLRTRRGLFSPSSSSSANLFPQAR